MDYHYPLEFARIGKEISISEYYLVSSKGAKSSSWFLYMKTKGRVEDELKKMGLAKVIIAQPGLLLD